MRRSTHPPKGTFSLDLHVLGTPPAFNLSQDQTLQLRVVSWLRFLIESQSVLFPEAAISRDLPDSLFNCQRTFPRPGTLAVAADSRSVGRNVNPTPAAPGSQHLPLSNPATRSSPEGSFYPVSPGQSTPFFKFLPEPHPPGRSEVSTRNHWPRQPLAENLFLSNPLPFQAAEELSTRSAWPRQLLFRPARIFFSRAARRAGRRFGALPRAPLRAPPVRRPGASRSGGSFYPRGAPGVNNNSQQK